MFWYWSNDNFLSRGVSTFLVDKTSNDDLFILLAAFRNGDNCKVLSNDYLRQHCHIIAREDPSLAQTFFRWQVSHQIRIDELQGFRKVKRLDEVNHCDPRFIWPQLHEQHCHQSDGSSHWHVPIIPEHNQNGIYLPNKWLCVKTNSWILFLFSEDDSKVFTSQS